MAQDRTFILERVASVSSPWLGLGAALINENFGVGYVSTAALRAMVCQPARSAVFIAYDESCLLGISTARAANRDDRLRVDRGLSILGLPRDTSTAVGLLGSVAVEPAARGNGIGYELTTAGVTFLRSQGHTVLYAESWLGSPGPRSDGILQRHGFEALGLVPGHWSRTQAPLMPCVICGPSCMCTGLLMRMTTRPDRVA